MKKTYEDYGIHLPYGAAESGKAQVYTTCPRCSHTRKARNKRKKCLSINLDKQVWYCHNCGWKGALGKDDYTSNYRPRSITKHLDVQHKDPKFWTLISDDVDISLNQIGQPLDALFHFLCQHWPKNIVRKTMQLCRIGFHNLLVQPNPLVQGRYIPCTVYWQIDAQQRVRTGKLQRYLPNGKRDPKETNSLWVHKIFKEQCSQSADPELKELANQWELRQCLYGEHLLKLDPNKERTVCLVEGQKNMLIGALWKPQHIWMAAGCADGLNAEKVSCLKDRHVIVFPDLDKHEKWTQQIPTLGLTHYEISDIVPKYAHPDDGPKADIADVILRWKNTQSMSA